MHTLYPYQAQQRLQAPHSPQDSHVRTQTSFFASLQETIRPAWDNTFSGAASNKKASSSDWIIVEHDEALPSSASRDPIVREPLSGSVKAEHATRDIPDYVLEYAPVIHLFSGEQFWPSDMVDHLEHITPFANFTVADPGAPKPNLDNLQELNQPDGRHIFLTSDDDPESRPRWLGSDFNKPSQPGQSRTFKGRSGNRNLKTDDGVGGQSNAPAVLVCVPKEDGVVDAFWFFFYSYNLGLKVLRVRFGNHVGDWEHTMIRFRNGTPEAVYFSEHFFGSAYTYRAVEKIGKRPVGYSAVGSHAMYGTAGTHRYILPWGLLADHTDKGPLWDPALNAHAYTLDLNSSQLFPSQHTPESPVNWFDFIGKWGDKQYPLRDHRQYTVFGQHHYVDGPTGPRRKDLGRVGMCSAHNKCVIKDALDTRGVRTLPEAWEEEEASCEA